MCGRSHGGQLGWVRGGRWTWSARWRRGTGRVEVPEGYRGSLAMEKVALATLVTGLALQAA